MKRQNLKFSAHKIISLHFAFSVLKQHSCGFLESGPREEPGHPPGESSSSSWGGSGKDMAVR